MKTKLRTYYISLWPSNQPPIDMGTIKAKNKRNALKSAEKLFNLQNDENLVISNTNAVSEYWKDGIY